MVRLGFLPFSLAFSLGSLPSFHAQAIRLHDLTNAEVEEAAITADGKFAVYTVHLVSGANELYSSSLDRFRPPIHLASTSRYLLGPTGHAVYYRADNTLWRDSADGLAAPLALSPTLPFGQNIASFLVSPDGARVVYLADQTTDQEFSLFSVPSDGSAAAVDLDGSLPLFAANSSPQYVFSPDGTWLAFAVLRGSGLYDLYGVPSDGSGPPVLLHGFSGIDTLLSPHLLQVSSTGWVVYAAAVNDRSRPYSVRIDGSSAPILLGGPFQAQASVEAVATRISPDGTRVVYHSDQQVDARYEIFSVPIDSSGPSIKLNAALPAQGDVDNSPYARTHEITADSLRVIYRADQEADGVFQLYSAPIDGSSPPVRLNAPLPLGGGVEAGFRVGAERAAYRADQNRDEVFELFSAPLEGGAPLRLNPSFEAFEHRDVFGFELSEDGKNALYVTNLDDVFQSELQGVPLDGGRSSQRLSPPPAVQATVRLSEYSQRGGRALFVGNLYGYELEPYLAFTTPPWRSAQPPPPPAPPRTP
jgi:WD40 repeat protein